MMPTRFDAIVVGGGFFGLYGAAVLLEKGLRVCLVERDPECGTRASFVNQARVHNGYHYPRSIGTAKGSIRFFKTFQAAFAPAINDRFLKLYAISNRNSFTSRRQFLRFCEFCAIPAREVHPGRFFRDGMVEAAFETEEVAFDGRILNQMALERVQGNPNFSLRVGVFPFAVEQDSTNWTVHLSDKSIVSAPLAINATYASLNEVQRLFGSDVLPLKYEMCEVILVRAGDLLQGVGITVMDGPFFSIMPFGLQGLHSLTSVEFTPHGNSGDPHPTFPCQVLQGKCKPTGLLNCDHCDAKPKSSFTYMAQLARKYLLPTFHFKYDRSLFAVKAILRASEVDDSRPTLIRCAESRPLLVTVFSGKISTVFEMQEVLLGVTQ